MAIVFTDSVIFIGKIRVERKVHMRNYRLVMYSAYEPCTISSHATIMTVDGRWFGNVSTKLPFNKKNEERAYKFIISAFPEAAFGRKNNGVIVGVPK